MTEFQRRVYKAATLIPEGKVTTYGLLAAHIGCRSPRAVGQALKANPFAPRVPCHRVIAGDLTIGGFGGDTRGERIRAKLELLASEGVHFEKGRLADERFLYRFESPSPQR